MQPATTENSREIVGGSGCREQCSKNDLAISGSYGPYRGDSLQLRDCANGDSNVVTGTFTTANADVTASGAIGEVTVSAPGGGACSARAVSITVRNAAGNPLNTVARRFWTRTALDAAAVDGGAGGLSVTCNGVGVFNLTGLGVVTGPGWLTFKDPNDDLNRHIAPVTFV